MRKWNCIEGGGGVVEQCMNNMRLVNSFFWVKFYIFFSERILRREQDVITSVKICSILQIVWKYCYVTVKVMERRVILKVHKNENFFGSDFDICTFS